MKKLFFILLLHLFLFSSCKSYQKEYEVLNVALNQNYSKVRECDTIDVLKKTSVLDNSFFKYYVKEKAEKERGFFTTAHIFVWINQNERWILTDDDLKYFQNSKVQSIAIKKERINEDKIKFKLVNKHIFESDKVKSRNITKRVLNCRYICEFGTPIFNKNKTIAIINRNEVLVNESNYLIYKFFNNEWKLVGYTEESSE